VKQKKLKGFSYTVSQEQIDAYRIWPIERRLHWLLIGNQLRKSLPKKTIKIQEAFRRGEI